MLCERGSNPGVVLEIALGILVGPSLLGWVSDEQLMELIANFGLAMLMFLAGYEIDFLSLRGKPLKLALAGWGSSVAIGIGLATVLGIWFDIPWMYVAFAISTTAIGTLLPILRDTGEVATRVGTFLLPPEPWASSARWWPYPSCSRGTGPREPSSCSLSSPQLRLWASCSPLALAGSGRARDRQHVGNKRSVRGPLAMLLLLGLVWTVRSSGSTSCSGRSRAA